MTESPNEYYSLEEAGKAAHVTKQAIYLAIQKGNLKAQKMTEATKYSRRGQWTIKKADLDEYRANKYNREKYTVNGEKVFDVEKGEFSVNQVAKILGKMLCESIPVAHIYYLIRVGELKCYRKGWALVVKKEDAMKIYEKKAGINKDQQTFA